MADPRFYKNFGPFTVEHLAQICGATLANEKDKSKIIQDVAALNVANENHISFFNNTRYSDQFTQSKAAACVIHPDDISKAPETMALILTPTPYRAYGLIAAAFYPSPEVAPKIHSSAQIDPSAQIGKNCSIGPFCSIEANVKIGDFCVLESNITLKSGSEIGNNCTIQDNVVISHSILGNNIRILPGVKIGQSGFGFFMDRQGHIPIPQLGRVIIQDNVEIGANTTIDRGAAGDTVIGKNTQIDNLVQIAHNVHIGRGCIIVAQVGIAGSTRIGDHTVIAGQVGIAGHLSIGQHVKIGAQSGVMRSIDDHETVAGSPAVSAKQWHRQTIILKKLTTLKKSADLK